MIINLKIDTFVPSVFLLLSTINFAQGISVNSNVGINMPVGLNVNVSTEYCINDHIGVGLSLDRFHITFPMELFLVKESFNVSSINTSLFYYTGSDIREAMILGLGGGLNFVSHWFLFSNRTGGSQAVNVGRGLSIFGYFRKNFTLIDNIFLNLHLQFKFIRNDYKYKEYLHVQDLEFWKYTSRRREFIIASVGVGLGLYLSN